MDFTREPMIETIITPREGYKLALKNSKGSGQEPFLLDSVEVVSFGRSTFFRSQERPKPFLLPVTDYEVVEVRETKMALKSALVERGIKITSGPSKGNKESSDSPTQEKKKERRKTRRKRVKEEDKKEKEEVAEKSPETFPDDENEKEARALIPPPATLISETIARYKETPVYSGAFFEKEEGEEETPSQEKTEQESLPQPQPEEELTPKAPEEES